MKVIHRVSLWSSPEVSDELAVFGVEVSARGFVAFDVEESHPCWPQLRAWIARRDAGDFVSTRFARSEVLRAEWLEVGPEWHHGFPQPNAGEFGFLKFTYDLTDWCPACGIGLRQVAPFQMKREPRWGRKGILQLNWVFDEYFATPDVWDRVFRPAGVGARSVLGARGVELKTVVQLVTTEEVGVVTEGLEQMTCSTCRRLKHDPIARGCFPPLKSEPRAAMVKTVEYFGSGASAYRCVIVAQALGGALLRSGVRGASFRPVLSTTREASA